VGTIHLQREIFPILSNYLRFVDVQSSFIEESKWFQIRDSVSKCDLPSFKIQSVLAKIFWDRKRKKVLDSEFLRRPEFESVKTQHQYILAANFRGEKEDKTSLFSKKVASQWLLAMPNRGLGMSMTTLEFRAAVGLRLLIPFFDPTPQPSVRMCTHGKCGKVVDPFAYHALSCVGAGGLCTLRHETLVYSVCAVGKDSGFGASLNPKIQCLADTEGGSLRRNRPADLLLNGNAPGSTCVDITIVSPLSNAKSNSRQGQEVGLLAREAALLKKKKHAEACDLSGLEFIPFAVDVCGVIDHAVADLLDKFAHKWAANHGKSFSYAVAIIRRRISCAIQIGVARQLVQISLPRSMAELESNDCSYSLLDTG
jgi:hypothetical protein